MFSGCYFLKAVQMDEGAKLYEGMFCNCEHLKSVTLPETLTVIPNLVFKKCISLKHINLPKSITKIDEGAFGLSGLESIDLSGSNSVYIGPDAFKLTEIVSVKLPIFGCTIDTAGFDDDILVHIEESYPLVAIK